MTTGRIAAQAWSGLGGDPAALDRLHVTGTGALPSAFAVTDLAAAALGVAALAVSELLRARHGAAPGVVVDRRLASFWFRYSVRPIGWALPAPWDDVAGDYQAADGWIRLHTNAPHHRAAALRVLGVEGGREAVAAAVAGWAATALETAVVAAGGCAAEMRPEPAWATHPQGLAVAAEPLVSWSPANAIQPRWSVPPDRPLAGLRVLDLTRVLAGPVATRFLAGYGADVLRIDPPGWDEPGVEPDVTLGKACARLDLHQPAGRATFEALLSEADVVVSGYRNGALDALGYGPAFRRATAPGLVDISLNAYGWTGPWAHRRGFDSLVQMSTGIADTGQGWQQAGKPVPLPVQALDHATGYLMAAAGVLGLLRRVRDGHGTEARLSLARTARFLSDQGLALPEPEHAKLNAADYAAEPERTGWGLAHRLRPAAIVDGAPMRWDRAAGPLGAALPAWTA